MTNSKFKSFNFLLAILTFNFCLFTLPQARAASSSNENLNLEIQNIGTEPENPSTDSGQGQQKPEALPRIDIKQASTPLSFAISQRLIDFGTLSSGDQSKRTLLLSITGSSKGYQIQAFEDNPPTGTNKQSLPDTTCDDGACSEVTDSIWNNELTYGFGFSLNNDTYRQFANLSKHEKPQFITSQSAEVIFKANIAPIQKPTSLSNQVTFIAVPNY